MLHEFSLHKSINSWLDLYKIEMIYKCYKLKLSVLIITIITD